MSTLPLTRAGPAPDDWRHGMVARGAALTLAIAALWLLATHLADRYHDGKIARAERRAEQGRVELTEGRTSAAVGHFREAVALHPDRPAYRFSLAQGLVTLGQTSEAEAYLRDILQQDAMNGPANRAMARLLSGLGRTADAEVSYYRAIYGLWPSGEQGARVETRLELIGLLGKTADRNRVRAELTQLAIAFPGDLTLQLQAGRSLLDLGFADDAARQFDQVSRRFAEPGSAYAGLAEAELQRGDYVSAFEAAQRAVAQDSGDRASIARRDVARSAMALDPSLPRLALRQRQNRTRQLIARTRAVLTACWADRPPDAETTAALEALDAATPRRGRPSPPDDQAQEALEESARLVVRDCATQMSEPGLSLVLRRLAR